MEHISNAGMNVVGKLKSERHHWWPRCVSQFWVGPDGGTGWIKPDGSEKRIPPAQLGMIGNGHHIKLAEPGIETPWDSTFEPEFQKADDHFPSVIEWLESLNRAAAQGSVTDRFLAQPATDDQLRMLTECVVSLAVRSPMNREASVALAEDLRGPLPERERNTLIAMNMRRSQRVVADSIGARAKFAVLFSEGREFIYGDGFFQNVKCVTDAPHSPKILAPLTPTLSVIICRPGSYLTEPRLSTIVLTDDEVAMCNDAVQVYAREMLFYRFEKPALIEAFTRGEHLEYGHPDNPIANLIRAMPGVPSRDASLDAFLQKRMGHAPS
jgi:hypothetical protein